MKKSELARMKERLAELERLDEFRREYQQLKAVCHSTIRRMMVYLASPTPGNLYAVHQILRDMERLTGDADFR